MDAKNISAANDRGRYCIEYADGLLYDDGQARVWDVPDKYRCEGARIFRLLDDDGNVYFRGYMLDLFEDADKAFAPLDDVGAAYGCTEMQYRENGQWKTL